jgi:hypothetical protein
LEFLDRNVINSLKNDQNYYLYLWDSDTFTYLCNFSLFFETFGNQTRALLKRLIHKNWAQGKVAQHHGEYVCKIWGLSAKPLPLKSSKYINFFNPKIIRSVVDRNSLKPMVSINSTYKITWVWKVNGFSTLFYTRNGRKFKIDVFSLSFRTEQTEPENIFSVTVTHCGELTCKRLSESDHKKNLFLFQVLPDTWFMKIWV